MSCDHCTDPDGVPCVPYYGGGPLARHAGYVPEPDEPGMGVYYCDRCGEGAPPGELIRHSAIRVGRTLARCVGVLCTVKVTVDWLVGWALRG